MPVQAVAPFEVLACKEELAHFLEHPITDCSVLDFAADSSEEQKLREFLVHSVGPELQASPQNDGESRRGSLHCWRSWWRQMPQRAAYQLPLPVAPMIRSQWAHGQSQLLGRKNVEVLVVSGRSKQHTAFLAVRSID